MLHSVVTVPEIQKDREELGELTGGRLERWKGWTSMLEALACMHEVLSSAPYLCMYVGPCGD